MSGSKVQLAHNIFLLIIGYSIIGRDLFFFFQSSFVSKKKTHKERKLVKCQDEAVEMFVHTFVSHDLLPEGGDIRSSNQEAKARS